MYEGSLTADGSTEWRVVQSEEGVKFSVKGDFGGGEITVEQQIMGVAYAAQTNSKAPIEEFGPFDRIVKFARGDKVRITLSGSTSPNLVFSITGAIHAV